MKTYIPSPKVEETSKKIFYSIMIAIGVICFLFPIGLQISRYFRINCNPNYSPCVANVKHDLDCSDIRFQVTVKGNDIYRLDSDDDGIGCESYRLEVFWQSIIFGAAGAWVGGWVGLFISLGYGMYKNKSQKRKQRDKLKDTPKNKKMFQALYEIRGINEKEQPKGQKLSSEELKILVAEAIKLIQTTGKASTAYFQRMLRINYTTAVDVMEKLESMEIVGQADGQNPRKIYITVDRKNQRKHTDK
jgi:hypothetical protein